MRYPMTMFRPRRVLEHDLGTKSGAKVFDIKAFCDRGLSLKHDLSPKTVTSRRSNPRASTSGS